MVDEANGSEVVFVGRLPRLLRGCMSELHLEEDNAQEGRESVLLLLARLHYLTVDQAYLTRRSTVLTPDDNGGDIS